MGSFPGNILNIWLENCGPLSGLIRTDQGAMQSVFIVLQANHLGPLRAERGHHCQRVSPWFLTNLAFSHQRCVNYQQ